MKPSYCHQNFQIINLFVRDGSWEFLGFITKCGCLILNSLILFQNTWIVIGFGCNCKSILKSGIQFGFLITFFAIDLDWIDIPKKLD